MDNNTLEAIDWYKNQVIKNNNTFENDKDTGYWQALHCSMWRMWLDKMGISHLIVKEGTPSFCSNTHQKADFSPDIIVPNLELEYASHDLREWTSWHEEGSSVSTIVPLIISFNPFDHANDIAGPAEIVGYDFAATICPTLPISNKCLDYETTGIEPLSIHFRLQAYSPDIVSFKTNPGLKRGYICAIDSSSMSIPTQCKNQIFGQAFLMSEDKLLMKQEARFSSFRGYLGRSFANDVVVSFFNRFAT